MSILVSAQSLKRDLWRRDDISNLINIVIIKYIFKTLNCILILHSWYTPIVHLCILSTPSNNKLPFQL